MTENEMAGWHQQLNRHESEQAPEDSEGQRSLTGCSPWGHKGSHTTEATEHKHTQGPGTHSAARSPVWMWFRHFLHR